MKLLHLYHDIMNLYGEYANVLAAERALQQKGIDCTVDRLSFPEELSLKDYDFVYIGSGTERNRNVVMEDLQRFRGEIESYIDSGRILLMTGNAFEMLGKRITDANGKVHEGLGLFDFTVTEQNKTRITGDAVFHGDFTDKPIVGFINKCSQISGITQPLFRVETGFGNQEGEMKEGIRKNNFFGTHLIGPLLMRNPFLADLGAALLQHSA